MEIIKFDQNQFQEAFDIKMCGILPRNKKNQSPFGASWGVVAPGKTSKAHRHDELETFFIVEGTGSLKCDGVITNVGPGDVVHFEPFELHTLINTGIDDLRFVTVYWRDQTEAAAFAVDQLQSDPAKSSKQVYVTSTPPTPNGDLHVGHLSGPYLGADVHTRYLKMLGIDAYHISGNDDFQSYVVAKSQQLGLNPRQTADQFATEIKATLDEMNVHLDQYIRPLHSSEYQNDLAIFLHNLWKLNILKEKENTALFDSHSNAYIYEVDVQGKCPHCSTTGRGNICEECGHPNMCVDMIDPISVLSKDQPVVKLIKRLHFPLSNYTDILKRHHDESVMGARLRVLFDQIKDKGLPDIAVSHPGNWGVTVPLNNFNDQIIWVWFEMAFGFLFGIREIERHAGRATDNITIPEGTRIVHFFGYDNAFYHTILFPAVYSAAFPENRLQIDYVYNEFYLLDGLKFSTSRGHAVWGKELLKEFSSDQIRFYLAYSRPETSRTNFTKEDIRNVIEKELLNGWQKWLSDLNKRIKSGFEGKVPDAGSWTLEQRNFYGRLQQYIQYATNAYSVTTFSLQKVSRILCELVREVNAFACSEQHWNKAVDCYSEYRTAMAIEIAAARLLALLAAPLMPVFSNKLWQQLGGINNPENIGWPKVPPFAEVGANINLSDSFFSQR